MSLSRDDEGDDDDSKSVASVKSVASAKSVAIRTPSTAGLIALRGVLHPMQVRTGRWALERQQDAAVLEIRTWSTQLMHDTYSMCNTFANRLASWRKKGEGSCCCRKRGEGGQRGEGGCCWRTSHTNEFPVGESSDTGRRFAGCVCMRSKAK